MKWRLSRVSGHEMEVSGTESADVSREREEEERV